MKTQRALAKGERQLVGRWASRSATDAADDRAVGATGDTGARKADRLARSELDRDEIGIDRLDRSGGGAGAVLDRAPTASEASAAALSFSIAALSSAWVMPISNLPSCSAKLDFDKLVSNLSVLIVTTSPLTAVTVPTGAPLASSNLGTDGKPASGLGQGRSKRRGKRQRRGSNSNKDAHFTFPIEKKGVSLASLA